MYVHQNCVIGLQLLVVQFTAILGETFEDLSFVFQQATLFVFHPQGCFAFSSREGAKECESLPVVAPGNAIVYFSTAGFDESGETCLHVLPDFAVYLPVGQICFGALFSLQSQFPAACTKSENLLCDPRGLGGFLSPQDFLCCRCEYLLNLARECFHVAIGLH